MTDYDMWRAGVQQDWANASLRLCIVRTLGQGQIQVVKAINADDGLTFDRGVEFETQDQSQQVQHWLSLPDGAARALLDALSQHYGGTGDTRQVRRDLDAERSRVDKLTDAVIDIARKVGES